VLQGPRRMLVQAPQPASLNGNDPAAAFAPPAAAQAPLQALKAHLNHGALAEALIAQRQHKRVEDAAAAAEAPAPAGGLPHASHKGGPRPPHAQSLQQSFGTPPARRTGVRMRKGQHRMRRHGRGAIREGGCCSPDREGAQRSRAAQRGWPLPSSQCYVPPDAPPFSLPHCLVRADLCSDHPPPGKYGCDEQRDFQKCFADFMIAGDFCKRTCGRCLGASVSFTLFHQTTTSPCVRVS